MLKLFKGLILTFLCLSLPFCGGYKPSNCPAVSQFIEKEFSAPAVEVTEEPGKIDIIIDKNRTMKGFVQAGDNSFENFLVSFNSTLFPKELVYYPLSKEIKSPVEYTSFLNPEYYDATELKFNEIKKLIKPDNIVILFTDFQFKERLDYLKLIPVCQEIFAEGKFIQILAARIPFSGKVYLDIVKESDYVEHQGDRPLYAIVIGSPRYYRFINDRMAKFKTWRYKLPFLNLRDTDPGNVRIKDLAPSFLTGIADSKFFKNYITLRSEDELSFKLEIENDIFFAWDNVSGEDINIESYKLEIEEGSVKEHRTDLKFDIKVSDAVVKGNKLIFRVKTEKITRTDTRVLRISVRPNNVPRWVEEWNVDLGDLNMNRAEKEEEDARDWRFLIKNKTVLLKNFIKNIVSSYQTPLTLTRVYVVID